jgi:hypothetical protein
VVVLICVVDHILQEFNTLFLTRFRTYKIAVPPQTKLTSKDDILGIGVFKVPSSCCMVPGSHFLVDWHKILRSSPLEFGGFVILQLFRVKAHNNLSYLEGN